MHRGNLTKLMDRWAREPKFREDLRRDLEGTLLRNGVKPGDAAWTALRGLALSN